MLSEEKKIVTQVVENYARTGSTGDGQVNVTCLPDNKTSCVEQAAGDNGRSIMLEEYRVEDKVIWAGYSGRTGMVYLSLVRSQLYG
jgi:hypothetical protein